MRKIIASLLLLLLFVTYAVAAGVSGVGVRTVYTSTNVGTSTWVVLVSSTQHTVSTIAVSDTSGQVMEVGICDATLTANSEVRQFLIPAGGITWNGQIPIGTRISIRAVSAIANSGENDFNVIF